MWTGIDFYSDTMTKPNNAMKEAMMNAVLGDEQKGEDPTTNALEEEMKARLNKSAAMFFPSATMCNQIAINLLTDAGDEIIGSIFSHVFTSEAGGSAFHSRVQARTIATKDGTFDREQLRDHVRFSDSPHAPIPSLLLIENTVNAAGGVVWPKNKLSRTLAMAKELGLKTHLDGARLFNAAVASNTDVKTLAEGFDTVTICFSKALGCATGAILAFDEKHWSRVRKLKQVFGGAMRQSGILAAACLYALQNNIEAIKQDHDHARILAKSLDAIDGIRVESTEPQSNMVFFAIDEAVMSPEQFLERCHQNRIRFSRFDVNRFRAVTHRDISRGHVDETVELLKRMFS